MPTWRSEISPNPPPRVLVLTHSHPRLTRGGAEISADSLVRGLRKHINAVAWLLGCSNKTQTDRLALNLTQPFGPNDFVYQTQGSFDYFKFANRDSKFPEMLSSLLKQLRPDVVHFHHYAQFGVEAFAIVKRTLPEAKVVLTLHEYLAICHNHGQMVKTKSLQLCEADSLIDCAMCFPDLSPRDFFLRKMYIQTFFSNVDVFISPSEFLAGRYARWGLPEDKIRVIENVPYERTENHHAGVDDIKPMKLSNGPEIARKSKVRVGFFGQMSPLKGISVLLDAAQELARSKVDNLIIDVFGDYSNQPPEFQKSVLEGLENASANVCYHGPYNNFHVHRLMRSVDAVIILSIWWENSPVVIQEAFTNARPVICSNIGGMAEKVRPGIDGLWFEANDSRSLAQVLFAIADEPGILTKLSKTVRSPEPGKTAIDAHLSAYGLPANLIEGVF